MRRSLLLLPLLALAAAGLTSCGEDEASAAELIRSAPAALEEAGTMRMEMTMAFAGQEIEAEGAFDVAAQTGTMTMSLPAPVDGEIEMIFDGTTYYMSTEAFGPAAPDGAQWVRIDLEELAELGGTGIDLEALTGAGSNNPTDALAGLEAVSEDGVEELGTEEIRGVATTHYSATLDMEETFEQAQEQLEASGVDDAIIDEEQFDRFIQSFGDDPIETEIWLDGDGLVRRNVMDMSVEGQSITMTMEMFDYGEPVDIQIPAEDETVGFLELIGDI